RNMIGFEAGPPQPARPPLLSGQPFIIFWGIRDSSCSGRPDPRSFGMEREGRVAVFYRDSLGNYPYFVDKDTPVNGGLPQHTRLDSHLQKTQQDLEAALPAPRYLGLGVLRWAEWVPQWSRNQEKQATYQEASRNLLRSFFPSWTPEEVEKWSKVDFEAAAQSVMMETLREVKRLRPKALWGMSPYPSCYNNSPAQTTLANYTGQCPAAEMALNDELLWLWKRSSALYPLLTLDKLQVGTVSPRRYLSSQIKEALRVSSLAGAEFDLPVFPLVKSVYASTNTPLSQADLVSTIGESAAMGTAGVVFWERRSSVSCLSHYTFVRKVLGPYSVNVTTATRLCSASLCQGKGRCVRQNPESSAYLHLPPPPTAAAAPQHIFSQLSGALCLTSGETTPSSFPRHCRKHSVVNKTITDGSIPFSCFISRVLVLLLTVILSRLHVCRYIFFINLCRFLSILLTQRSDGWFRFFCSSCKFICYFSLKYTLKTKGI
uniref:Hyaluronidase n=1 Tax=Stegastes partitus TaxID=144197 RepID=A0A3B5A9M6_9TELE